MYYMRKDSVGNWCICYGALQSDKDWHVTALVKADQKDAALHAAKVVSWLNGGKEPFSLPYWIGS